MKSERRAFLYHPSESTPEVILMRNESVRFGRTLECECGAQMNFEFNATASVQKIEIIGKCPNCKKDIAIKMDTGGAGSGSFEFQDIAEGEESEALDPSSSSSDSSGSTNPSTKEYSGYSPSSSGSPGKNPYDMFNTP
jgi:hypothetical protein